VKKTIDKSRQQELAVYVIIWVGALVAPAFCHMLDVLQNDGVYDWGLVWKAMMGMVPFFVLFWLHDLLVAPCILRRDTRRQYVVRVVAVLSLFALSQHALRPHDTPFDDRPMPMERPMKPLDADNKPPLKPERHDAPPNPIGMVRFAMAMMLCGLNVGVKLFFKSRSDEMRMMETERHALEKELEFLTYQINPHFFMNTLNNIHVLIDIDPQKAKFAVIELSKMLRFALYEGSATTVGLRQELDCVGHYVELMKLRFTEKVDIAMSLPDDTQNAVIPPMLLMTFIENAFKHGISYRKQSFIYIATSVEGGQMHFACVNSVAPRHTPSNGGVGLENVKKRLKLIYKDKYNLDIQSDADTFSVRLTLPLSV